MSIIHDNFFSHNCKDVENTNYCFNNWCLEELKVNLNGSSCKPIHVRDDPKLPDDSGEVPKPNGVVDGLILAVKLSLYLTNK